MQSLDLERVRQIARARRQEFAGARPFPHLVIDDLLYPDVAAALTVEFASAVGEWIFILLRRLSTLRAKWTAHD